ncbi:MAG: proton-conducting transporter membrane subunit [Sulfurospirillaceae bacterium]|nr:proton-conducting transporter membrane subunit [Sulfurospirillaceae bacterium]
MLFLVSICCILGAGILPFFWASTQPILSDKFSTTMHIIGSLSGLIFVFIQISYQSTIQYMLPLQTMFGTFSVRFDTMSMLFLIPIYIISAMSSLYSISYWPTLTKGLSVSLKYRLYLSFFTLFMLLLVIADNFIMFLICWEIMSLLAYFLITIDEFNDESQSAGYLYIIATHSGVIALFGMFAILQTHFGFYDFSSAIGNVNVNLDFASAIFLLGLFGFGIKAGIFPLYFWLPNAHASAPVAVSALLSGVMIKMGIYGIVRVISFFISIPHWWGWLVFGLGIISGILGVVYAIAQHDIKKLLAYHSIENIGIIVIGVGLAMLGKSYHNDILILFGLAGALFHIINHSLFKPLLFYSAGSMIEKYHTRNISHYGGIIKVQPLTALFFLIGAVAISGLPPFNGFASEWLLYLGMFKSLLSTQNALLPVIGGVLALSVIGGLALACFVKVFGISFLGKPRHIELSNIKESAWPMLLPMAILSVICFILGVFPFVVEELLSRIVLIFNHQPINFKLEAMTDLSYAYMWFFSLFALIAGILFYTFRDKIQMNIDTWACAFPYGSSKIQYTPASLAEMIMGLFSWTLKSRHNELSVKGIFVKKYQYYLHQNDKIIYFLIKTTDAFLVYASKIRTLIHNGYMGIYVLYIFTALIIMLLYVGQ